MGMDLIEDLKEGRKEISNLIRTLEKMQHKIGLMRDGLKARGFTDEQISIVQEAWDELIGN